MDDNRVPATKATNTEALLSMAGSIAEPETNKMKNTVNEMIENS